MKTQTATADAAEIEKFSRLAESWWDARGPFAPLHRINGLRVEWITKVIGASCLVPGEENHETPGTGHRAHLKGLRLLDVGCGGGLVCEPMAKLGISVTGIDASQENIEVAKAHAARSDLEIDYRNTTAEELVAGDSWLVAREEKIPVTSHQPPATPPFDVVLALEIIEHVADIPAFAAATCKLVKPGGLIIYSTLNRTAKSFALGIVAAEYILRWVPKGTHDWNKFVKPSELARALRSNGIEISEMTGLVMNPLTWKWELSARDVDVNYMVAGRKALEARL